MSEPSAPDRYQLRIVLRHISPLIWRRVVVPADVTLARLHEVVQVAMGWCDEHLNRFHIHGQDHGVAKIGTTGYGDPYNVRLADFRLRVGERFLYEYNFHAPWEHDIRVERKQPAEPQRPWPVCVGGQRACPPEHLYGPEAYLRWLRSRSSLETWWALEEAMQRIATLVQKRLDTEEALPEDEYFELQEAALLLEEYTDFTPEQFDRRAVNAELKERWQA
jgi:hypothetical protein